MSIALRHVGIVVSDMARSLDLYQNFLGLELKKYTDRVLGSHVDTMAGIQDVEMRIALLRTEDNGRIELIEYLSHRGKKREPVLSNDIGASHFALTVKNIDKLYERHTAYDVKFVSPPSVMPDGFVKMAYAVLLGECIVELVQVLDERARFSGGP